eukprot:gene43005-53366_t
MDRELSLVERTRMRLHRPHQFPHALQVLLGKAA